MQYHQLVLTRNAPTYKMEAMIHALYHFRWNVVGCSKDSVCFGTFQLFTDTKITKFDYTFLREKDVGCLQISEIEL